MARSLITWQIMTNAESTHHNTTAGGNRPGTQGTLLASSSGNYPVARVSQLWHKITSKYCAQLLLWLVEKVDLLWCLDNWIKCAWSKFIHCWNIGVEVREIFTVQKHMMTRSVACSMFPQCMVSVARPVPGLGPPSNDTNDIQAASTSHTASPPTNRSLWPYKASSDRFLTVMRPSTVIY